MFSSLWFSFMRIVCGHRGNASAVTMWGLRQVEFRFQFRFRLVSFFWNTWWLRKFRQGAFLSATFWWSCTSTTLHRKVPWWSCPCDSRRISMRMSYFGWIEGLKFFRIRVMDGWNSHWNLCCSKAKEITSLNTWIQRIQIKNL